MRREYPGALYLYQETKKIHSRLQGVTMKCGYLLQFSVENYERSVSYYIGHNKPYVQGVAELREYCSCGGYGECPVALWRDSMTRGDVALPVSGAAGREIGEECSSR